jgi:thiol-disulfide isomerase/thioredoxin
MCGMGKASRTKQAPDRRARIAAQREAARRSEQRKRIYIAGGSILAVIIVVVAFVLIKGNSNGSGSTGSNGPTGTALTTLTNQVTGVPASTQDSVGAGTVASSNFMNASGIASASANDQSYFATVNGSPLTSGGKPEVLYIGAEYCPFCAAQRWAMIVSLSRFGTFSGLSTIHSSSTDIYPNTPTFTFYGSKYTSKYVTFTPVEETTETETPLQSPTAAQQALIAKYDPGTSSGSPIPFIDIGNKYVEVGNLSQYGPTVLAGKTWSEIAAALTQPNSTIAKGILGSANYMTAGICTQTGNQPASACTPAIKSLEGNFAS